LRPGDAVLLKASRGVKLERALERISDLAANPREGTSIADNRQNLKPHRGETETRSYTENKVKISTTERDGENSEKREGLRDDWNESG
jgi:hypothetical protein